MPKKETPMIALFISSGQTWTTGELMRLTLSHVVCESLIFSPFYNIMRIKENLFEPKREKHVTKREGVMEAMEQTRWTLVLKRYFLTLPRKGMDTFALLREIVEINMNTSNIIYQ